MRESSSRWQPLVSLVDEADRLAGRRGMALHSLVWGGGYLFGPDEWQSSSSFDVIRWLSMPIRGWGLLLVLLGVLMLIPRSRPQAHALAGVFWFTWAAGLLLALPYGSLAAWGSWLQALVVSYVHRCLSRPRAQSCVHA